MVVFLVITLDFQISIEEKHLLEDVSKFIIIS